jgi:hypothetical protein
VKLKGAATFLLCPVHRGIGMFQEIVDIVIIGGVNGNPDADANRWTMRTQLEGFSQRFGNPLSHDRDVLIR